MEEIGKVNGEHLARHLFLTRRACHAISRSLPLAHGPLCSFHSMDGVERSGEEEGKVNRDKRGGAREQWSANSRSNSVLHHFQFG